MYDCKKDKFRRTRKQMNGPNSGFEHLFEVGGAVAPSRISENIFFSLCCCFILIRIIQLCLSVYGIVICLGIIQIIH